MKGIGLELNNATGALHLGGDNRSCMHVLDLCVAPGGYRAAVLDLNPTASIDAVSPPHQDGGHRVLYLLSDDAILVRKSFSRTSRCVLLNMASI
jgi:hypothetical protein